MIARAVHAILPLAVIAAATVLTVTGHLSQDPAVAMISAAGSLGAGLVATRPTTPTK